MDNSTVTEYARCPRRGLYRYGLRRGFVGQSWAIQYGLAYHKYREVVENLMIKRKCKMNDEVHQLAFEAATAGWEDPPLEHKHAYLDLPRLIEALIIARQRIESEQRSGQISVLRAEDAFDLELPFLLCKKCSWATLDENEVVHCSNCGNSDGEGFIHARHGGRIDQFIVFHTLNDGKYVRDFKTTGWKDRNYEQKFDPNSALQGYTWAAGELSGRAFQGTLIETVYNTKLKGPIISQHYVTYSKNQQENWLASLMMERQFIQTMWDRSEELGYLAFPQRTEACGDYGGCGFREACRTGGVYELENWLKNETTYSEWDFTNPEKETANEP